MVSLFQDIPVEAEVIALGSIKGVMPGKHYNRVMRSHKIMFEALQRMRFQAFLSSLNEDHRADAEATMSLAGQSYSEGNLVAFSASSSISKLYRQYSEYITGEDEFELYFQLLVPVYPGEYTVLKCHDNTMGSKTL